MSDISIINSGSICLVTPRTQQAKDWVKENVYLETWQCSGESFYVEPRYLEDLSEGMEEAGLTILV